jgi:hypothetical protein
VCASPLDALHLPSHDVTLITSTRIDQHITQPLMDMASYEFVAPSTIYILLGWQSTITNKGDVTDRHNLWDASITNVSSISNLLEIETIDSEVVRILKFL